MVKIQVNQLDLSSGLLVYNKEKSLYIILNREGNESVHNELCERICSEGFQGIKGYFHAILEVQEEGKKELLKINTVRIGPVEPW